MRNTKRAKWICAISFVALAWLATSTMSYESCQVAHKQTTKEDKTKEPQPVPKRRDVFDDLTIFVQCELSVIAGRIDYEDAFREPRFIEFTYRNGDFAEGSIFLRNVGWTVQYMSHEPEPISYGSN